MQVIQLSREEYLVSAKRLEDFDSLKFAKSSLDWWDDHYSWKNFPPLCLIDDANNHLCYLFYHVSKNRDYLTIHNILTPKKYRDRGYAYQMLKQLFVDLSLENIERFKLWCVSSSVDFYSKLGLNYWGVNNIGQYYCDFSMPKLSISEIPAIVKNTKLKEFSTSNLNLIYDKLKQNGCKFNKKDKQIYDDCVESMKSRYRFDFFEREVQHRESLKEVK